MKRTDFKTMISGARVLFHRRSVRQHAVPPDARTCNQAVMSGSISISFVDFAVLSFVFDRVRCASMRSILVQNWCGGSIRVRTIARRSDFAWATAVAPVE